MDLYHQDVISLETIVKKTSHNVAKGFKLKTEDISEKDIMLIL